MSFGIGHRKCPNELWKHQNEYVRAMLLRDGHLQAMQGSGNAGTAKNREKCAKTCCFWHMFEEPGAESATKLSACRGLAPQKMLKNVWVFATFSLKHAQRIADVSLGSHKMSPFKPHLSSGNAQNEFQEPRNKNKICG